MECLLTTWLVLSFFFFNSGHCLPAADHVTIAAANSTQLPLSMSSLSPSLNLSSVETGGQRRSYKGYSVLRLTPTSSDQLDFLRSLELKDPELDFWTQPCGLNKSVDVMVPPKTTLKFEKSLRRLNIDKQLMIEDVERIVSKERQALEEAATDADSLTFRSTGSSFFTLYHREDRINEFLDGLGYTYPDHVTVSSIGKSSEGRDIKLIKVTATKSQPSTSKPAVYIDGGMHAREWIAVTTALYVAEKLAGGYASDASIKRLLDHYDFFIIPLANPDGYEYTHARDRLWRKTRSRHLPYGISFFGCRGVDPNRNFDFHWNEVGASDNPCTDVYAGPRAFSEPETRAIADFVLANKDQIKIFIALHAYSQLWLTPWGYTATLPSTYYELEARALAATKALSQKYGTMYQVGSSTNILYAASGGADDWAHGVAKIPYVYTVELRDSGRYGFMLPKDQIIPTGEEFFDGLSHLAAQLIPDDVN